MTNAKNLAKTLAKSPSESLGESLGLDHMHGPSHMHGPYAWQDSLRDSFFTRAIGRFPLEDDAQEDECDTEGEREFDCSRNLGGGGAVEACEMEGWEET